MCMCGEKRIKKYSDQTRLLFNSNTQVQSCHTSVIAAVRASSRVTHTSSLANLRSSSRSLVDKVTADDIELAKRHGVDLSFVTLKDTE